MTFRRTIRSGFWPSQALVVASAVFLTVAAASTTSNAESGTKKTARRAQPARASQTAPDTTGSIASPHEEARRAAPSASQSKAEDDNILDPYYLPNVPRDRMHACGLKWQAKKMSGDTGDDDWRDFATKCLVAKNSPATQ